MDYILYNPFSNSKKKKTNVDFREELKKDFNNPEIIDSTTIDLKEFIKNKTLDDNVILVGGDGTLNYFINAVSNTYSTNLYLFSSGTGDDFLKDIGMQGHLVKLNDYLKNVPYVIFNEDGKKRYFLNNVGFGLDGMVCKLADDQKIKGKPVSYFKAAVKLLLYKFKPRNVKIISNGKTYEYKKCWMAPTMNGKFYGGGMRMGADQDRLKGTMSLCVVHGSGRIRTMLAFGDVYKGTHAKKHPKICHFEEVNEVYVEFDKPCAIQIDGEVTNNVYSYHAYKN